MIEIECPKCKSKEMEEVEFDHQWLSTIDKEGCANIIYYCPKCNNFLKIFYKKVYNKNQNVYRKHN